jgi:hypothetical protein
MPQKEYDVYINSIGYHLARSSGGGIPSGGERIQSVDPFSVHVSQEKPYEEVVFKFSAGAGQRYYDGSERYRWGANVDSRSGDLELGPYWRQNAPDSQVNDYRVMSPSLDEWELSTATAPGFAEQFQTPSTAGSFPYRNFGILVHRKLALDYAGAVDFRVEIWTDVAGEPTALVGTATVNMPLAFIADEWLPEEDGWLRGDWFWLVGSFPDHFTLTGSTSYWFCVINPQAAPLYWAQDKVGDYAQVLTATGGGGGAWAAATKRRPVFFKFLPEKAVDREVNKFIAWRDPANNRKMYAAVGPKVMVYRETYHPATEECAQWDISKADFVGKVTDLCDYAGFLWAGQATAGPMWVYGTDGASTDWFRVCKYPGPPWVGCKQGTFFCVHNEILWRSLGNALLGVKVAKGTTPQTLYHLFDSPGVAHVGDDGTPITALCSHLGKLYAAKPEGIYEITIPEGYPGTETVPTATLLIDFVTDRAGRPFLIDWQSGLYFNSTGGLYEFKSGLLQNVYQLYVDDEAFMDSPDGTQTGWWRSACATIRGLLLAASPRWDRQGALWHFHSGEWVPLGVQNTQGTFFVPIIPVYLGELIGAVFLESRGGGLGRLWLGNGFGIRMADWPTWTDDRSLADPELNRFVSKASVRTPDFDNGDPATAKDWCRLRVLSENLAAGIGVDITMYVDGIWYPAHHSFSVSPFEEVDISPTVPAGHTCSLDIGLTGGDTLSPVLKSVILLYQSLPNTAQTWQLTVSGQNYHPLRNGGVDTRTALGVWNDLKALLELTSPTTFEDEFGITHTVRALSITADTILETEDVGATQHTLALGIIVSLLEMPPLP